MTNDEAGQGQESGSNDAKSRGIDERPGAIRLVGAHYVPKMRLVDGLAQGRRATSTGERGEPGN